MAFAMGTLRCFRFFLSVADGGCNAVFLVNLRTSLCDMMLLLKEKSHTRKMRVWLLGNRGSLHFLSCSVLGIDLSILSLAHQDLRRKSRTVPILCGFVPIMCKFVLDNNCFFYTKFKRNGWLYVSKVIDRKRSYGLAF